MRITMRILRRLKIWFTELGKTNCIHCNERVKKSETVGYGSGGITKRICVDCLINFKTEYQREIQE